MKLHLTSEAVVQDLFIYYFCIIPWRQPHVFFAVALAFEFFEIRIWIGIDNAQSDVVTLSQKGGFWVDFLLRNQYLSFDTAVLQCSFMFCDFALRARVWCTRFPRSPVGVNVSVGPGLRFIPFHSRQFSKLAKAAQLWTLSQLRRFLEMMQSNAKLVLRRMMQAKNISGFSFRCKFWDFWLGLLIAPVKFVQWTQVATICVATYRC